MKNIFKASVLLLLVLILSGCGVDGGSSLRGNPPTGEATDSNVYAPYDAAAFSVMNQADVESLFRDSGFRNITLKAIDDIDSESGIQDGAIDKVTINGEEDFSSRTAFSSDAEVIIFFHNIPKIVPPMSPVEASAANYMDVGERFYNAGFVNIITDEVYDLRADESPQTIVAIDGQEIDYTTPIPFDSMFSITGHYPVSLYKIRIEIDFKANLLFSKYDVVVTLNDVELGTLPHGEKGACEVSLPIGQYELGFHKTDEEDICGSAVLKVDSDATVGYQISCNRKGVEVEETGVAPTLSSWSLEMPYSNSHYLRKEYQAVVSELKALGFTNVTAVSTSECLWLPPVINEVVKVTVNGYSIFDRDHVFSKTAPVVVYYHVPDFLFELNSIRVTEKESFVLPYNLTSGDSIRSLSIEIDHPEVLQMNEDGSFTALIPGTATVSVSGGGHLYSSCRVDVNEIIIPLESVSFVTDEMDVIVGNTFILEYSAYPENANYIDTTISVSAPEITKEEGNNTFYVNSAGDSEISIYQDDRLLGTCIIHAAAVEIEELVLDESQEELFIGETLDLRFSLLPENATNKGITAVSSRPQIAEVDFDERGDSIVKVTGLTAGDAEITITVPNGSTYSRTVTVNEIQPSEIVLTNSATRIEVGMPINVAVSWNPGNTSVKELTWTTSNSTVIKVNEDGSLEAVGVGSADITAIHKSGVSGTITVTVSPTPVSSISLTTDQVRSNNFVKGDTFTITASVSPQNATDQTITYSSHDPAIATVSDKGVVTAVGAGTTWITAKSPDGPSQQIMVTVSPSPQKFRITYSTRIVSNNNVGYNWSYEFSVNGEPFSNGSYITVEPGAKFTVALYIEEYDKNPDTGSFIKEIPYSDDLCKNGWSISDSILVTENSGRYSGHNAEWDFWISITPC